MEHKHEDFCKEIEQVANLYGWFVFRVRPVMFANGHYATQVAAQGVGYPDQTLVNPDKKLIMWFEVKIPPDKCKPEQLEWHQRIKDAGGIVMVVTPADWDTIVDVMSGQGG